MKFFKNCAVILISAFSMVFLNAKGPKIFYKTDTFEFAVGCKVENETTGDFNATLFNSKAHDKLTANQTVMNFSMLSKVVGSLDAKIVLRNKVVWGNHKVIRTDAAWLKNGDATPTDHFHKIGPNMVWVREIWTKFDLTNIFKMTDILTQSLTLGSFSFQLGRGIALGDVYSVNPASLGFFQDNAVDQYAWGVKLSGGLIKDFMNYDLYCSILDNKSTSIAETNFPTQAKAFGTSKSIVRGPGKITFVTAGHLLITPINDKVCGTMFSFEPYFMSYHDPEQKVEFFCDSRAHLSTIGFAAEFSSNRLEFGVDCASNFGSQYVKGWDRNQIKSVNQNGYAAYVYTDVYNVDPSIVTPTPANYVLYDPANTAQTAAINKVTPGALSNGKPITGTSLYNSMTRYRSPYKNSFGGFMVVTDVSLWLKPKEISLNTTVGISTGDQNPNVNLFDPNDSKPDRTYNAFIPFQELYSGKRVQSFFGMLSGFVRPLSLEPNTTGGKQTYAALVDNFSNLVFWGGGVSYTPQTVVRLWNVSSNIICYWQDVASNKFDIQTGKSLLEPADKYLGTEFNLLFKCDLSAETYLIAGGALFVPGQHYLDIKGKPTNSDQRSALDAAIAAGIPTNTLPLIGDSTALSLSMAIGYLF